MTTQPEIKQLLEFATPQGNALIGLGVDSRTYYWSFDKGEWQPNWYVPAAANGAATIPPDVAQVLKRATSKTAQKKRARG